VFRKHITGLEAQKDRIETIRPSESCLNWVLELGSGAAAAALGLTTLGPILFLRGDEAQSASMFADNARAFDALLEATKQLIERLGILDLNTHT